MREHEGDPGEYVEGKLTPKEKFEDFYNQDVICEGLWPVEAIWLTEKLCIVFRVCSSI